jgi:hypothetical protein
VQPAADYFIIIPLSVSAREKNHIVLRNLSYI